MIGDRSMERQCNGVDKHVWQKTMDLRWGSKPFQSIYDTMFFYEMKKVLEQRHICSCSAEKWEEV